MRPLRGTLLRRGQHYFVRLRYVDADGRERVREHNLGRFRSRATADAARDRYVALLKPETVAPGATVLFGRYAMKFLAERTPLVRLSTAQLYRGVVHRYLRPLFDVPLVDVDAARARELVAELAASGLGRETIATARRLLLTVLKAAIADGFAAHRLTQSDIRLPPVRTPPHRPFLRPADVRRVLAMAPPRDAALFGLCGLGGLRISEALGVCWGDLDLEASILTVRAQSGPDGSRVPLKTSRSARQVPLLAELVDLLRAYRPHCPPHPQGYLFARPNGSHALGDAALRRFRRLLAEAGLPRAGTHALRRSAPAILAEAGLSGAAIARVLGDSVARSETYVNIHAADLVATIRQKQNATDSSRNVGATSAHAAESP